jgi:heavy metal efflux system protein
MNSIIAFSLRRRVFVVVSLLFLIVGGIGAFRVLNIESYPDPVPPLVDIVTQSPGQSSEEIERYITIPIETQMAGIPHVAAIRTISLFGLSDVRLQFTYDFTYEEAEQRVVNALAQLGQLPGVGGSGAQQNPPQPQISPWSPIGEIYRYRVVGPPNYSIMDLKTIQDWILEPRFKAVPGVIDVNGFGGKTKIYAVTVDLGKLDYYGLTLPQLLQALNNSNLNVGGQTVNFGEQSAVVRGIALIHSMDDIRNTMVSANNGSPVLVSDVATVTVDYKPRLGIVGQDDEDEIIQGIVLMRRDAQSLPTIRAIEAEVDKINSSNILPPGVRIEGIYDRSGLINLTTSTVLHNLLLGLALIFAVQLIFLGNLRSAVIVAATIPFALSFAVGIMVLRGDSANLLSVGAIDFGLVVGASVIMVENIFRHLSSGARLRPDHLGRLAEAEKAGFRGRLATILAAAREVDRSIFFSAAIIVAGFLPLFTLQGIEGHIFSPMAKTYAYAIAGGLIAAFTVSPALAALLLSERMEERETLVMRFLRRLYRPVVEFALANRIVILGSTGVLVVLAIFAARSLGLEFLPHLEEGNLWIRATMPPSVSLEKSHDYVNRMRALIKSFPEVETVVSQHGRPDDGTDPTSFFEAEFFAPLKDPKTWPAGVDKAKLVAQVGQALDASFPGVDFNLSQYIQDNVEEAASGVKGENAVKLFGNDLATLQDTAGKIEQVLRRVPGIFDVGAYDTLGQPTVKIDIDRARAARYGLAPGDINATVQAAIGGQAAGNLYETGSDRNFPIVVRLASDQRQSLDAIRRITVSAQGGGGGGGSDDSAAAGGAGGAVQTPLSEVAKISMVNGAFFIFRENRERYLPIKFSVRGRDLGGAVAEAQRRVADEVRLPGECYLKWQGEFGDLEDALARLKVVVPASLALIVLLVFIAFPSVTDTLLVASVMPMALIGGIFALYGAGMPFSVSAAIGFIGLFGVSVMEGIIILTYFNQLIDGGLDSSSALLRACQTRLRPVLMTCFSACVGLLPAAVSTGIGAQVQKPLAVVVVGGILLAPVLILIVLPVLIDVFSRRRKEFGVAQAQPEAGE